MSDPQSVRGHSDTSWLRPWLGAAATIVLLAVAWRVVFSPDPLTVKVVAIERGTVESTVTNSKAGTLRSRTRSRISAETGGRVTRIFFREGDAVQKGALLVKLNDASMQARLELSEATITTSVQRHREACFKQDHAQRDLDRTRELARNQVASEEILDRLEVAYQAAEAGCNGAEAQVARSRAELRVAQAELDKTEIRAPFDGIVAEVNAEVGEWVTPSPPMLTAPSVIDMLDPKSVYVSAPMDEVDSNRIRVGQPAKITIDSHPEESFEGSVVRVAPYVLDIEAQNRTVEVEVEFDLAPPVETIMVGTSTDIEITLDAHHNALRIPTQTLLQDGHVLLVVDGLIEERSVEVGLRNWDFVEILTGLEIGDQVVASLDDREVKAGTRARVEMIPADPEANIGTDVDDPRGTASDPRLPESGTADVGAGR
jgi:HlyD family secretion protein